MPERTSQGEDDEPTPARISAIPTTIPKSEVPSARNDVYRAVASAVSVTQMLRAPLDTGLPSASFCAAAGSFVPALSLGSAADTYWPICAYVRPPVLSSAWIRM
jgi:hypothetical protein